LEFNIYSKWNEVKENIPGQAGLDSVAAIRRPLREKIPNHIRIESRTERVPIRTPKFPSNWELSTARAASIIHCALTHYQFEPTRLSASGYGEFHPIAPNNTHEGRSPNRRVDLVILSSKERENEPRGGGHI